MQQRPFRFNMSRIRLISAFAIAVLVILMAASAIIPLTTSRIFNEITATWQKSNVVSEQKGRLIWKIDRHIGYGGFIHNFKNYVLRKDPSYREKVARDLEELRSALQQLKGIYQHESSSGAKTNLAAVQTIRDIVELYADNLEIGDEAIVQNWPPQTTDSMVRVDDTPAIDAFTILRDSWRREALRTRVAFEELVGTTIERFQWLLFFLPFLLVASGTVVWFVRHLSQAVAEREMAQEELLRANLMVESIAHLGQGVSIFDEDLNLVAFNENFFELLEFPKELGTPGTSLAEFFRINAERGEYGPGDVVTQVKERMALARRFEPHLMERVRPNGKVIEVHGIPLPNGGIVTTYTDISARKKAEKALAEKERQLRTALNNMTDGIFALDKDLRLTLFNNRYFEFINLPASIATIGMPFENVVRIAASRGDYGPGEIEEQMQNRLAFFRSPDRDNTEITVDNGRRILEYRKAPLAAGGAVIVVSDITERRRAESEIGLKEAQLSAALESMSAGIMLIDKQFKVQLFNDAASTLYQFPKDIVRVGTPLQALIRIRAERGDFGDGRPDELAKARFEGFQRGELGRFIDTVPGGRTLDVFRAVTPDDDIVVVFHDITDRVRSEEKLRENEAQLTQNITDLVVAQDFLEKQSHELAELAEKLAEEKERAQASERSKSEFLASMSHEIRTPMTGVLGLADILLDADLPAPHQKTVQKIKGAGQSLLTIINDILDLSKLEAGKLEIENIDFNLLAVIDDAVDLIHPRAEQRGLILTTDSPRDLPHSLVGDPTRIRQILINLAGNAVKFTHEGGVTVRAQHRPIGENSVEIRIEVEDTGIGIPSNAIDKLFQDFTQADSSTSRRYEGTGLGLSISKRLTELMGGEIGVESELGKGSVFWFTFHADLAEAPVARGIHPHRKLEVTAGRALSIMIAEDNQLNQLILSSVLAPLGHDLTFAASGVEAVELVKSKAFDLILMDVRMPEMSGPDATRAIRQMGDGFKTLPIVAVTADVMEDHIAGYFEAGMNAYATKPIERIALLTTINEVMGEEVHVFEEAKDDDEPTALAETATDNPDAAEPDSEVHGDVAAFLESLQSMTSDN